MRDKDIVPLSNATARIVDCGIDWLTITSAKGLAGHESDLANWWETSKLHRWSTGVSEPATFLGYNGIKSEHLFVGTRWDGALIRMSGKFAREEWQSVQCTDGTITRMDVQVTVEWEGEGPHPPRMAAILAEAANEQLPTSRQRSIEETKDNKGGYTTYIGSRQSASFSRTYHKSAQSPDEYGPNCYRYEVQFNKDSAGSVYKVLRAYNDDMEHAYIATVWDWYEKRGVIPVFRRSGSVVNIPREVLELTTIDRKLKWLYNQVRPTVLELIGSGYRQEVLVGLLGIDLGKDVETTLVSIDLAEQVLPLILNPSPDDSPSP